MLAFLRGNFSDYLLCGLVLLNSVSIGMQVDYMAGHADEEVPQAYRISEVVFGSLFTVELLSKLCYYRKAFFMSHNWRWNVFDLLVVVLQLMEMTVTAAFSGGDAPDSFMASNMKFVGLIRFLRLVRVLRLLRLFNVIRQLNKLVYLILGSFEFFLWGLLLLFLQTYMTAIFLTQIVADHLRSLPKDSSSSLGRLYGSLGSTVFHLFAATTGGIDWTELAYPLMQEIDPMLAIVLCLHIAFSVMVVMNLVTGVLLTELKLLFLEDRQIQLIDQVKQVFKQAGEEDKEFLTWSEYCKLMDHASMRNVLEALTIDKAQAGMLFHLVEKSKDKEVTVEARPAALSY
ncbi:unnamed protein product [Polarella glacialis]|uniref:Ion transport domain-containing protein n=1 Tax=Polarella glacialis TaxID=89957 RepID=A0A813FX27_POLGL|nr:unnamed protein product [Polarella glacialis]